MPYLGLIILALQIAALVDVIVADEHRVRGLPRMVWLLLVIFLPLVGGIAWFAVGRPLGAGPAQTRTTGFPEYDRPGRQVAQYPDDDEEFLRKVRERAEEQRQRAKGDDARNFGDPTDER